MNPDVVFLYATAPDSAAARRIAEELVGRRAAACVNIIAGMSSVYRWRDAVESADELVLIIKCARSSAQRAREIIRELHPHETPAIAAIAIDSENSSGQFLRWVAENSRP